MEVSNIIKSIIRQFDENVNSHIFLFETNDIGRAYDDVKKIIENVLKADNSIVNQIESENYIEAITIRPIEQFIVKEQISDLQNRLKTKPVLSDYLFYTILECDKMSENLANKMLKTIEEPCDNVIGFLITENSSLILPTIKSRAQIENLIYDEGTVDEEETEIVHNVVKKIIDLLENSTLLDFNIYKMQKDVKETLKSNSRMVANLLKDYYNSACNLNLNKSLDENTIAFIRKNNSPGVILKIAEYLNEKIDKLIFNMNSDLMFEKFFIELKEVKKDADDRGKVQ